MNITRNAAGTAALVLVLTVLLVSAATREGQAVDTNPSTAPVPDIAAEMALDVQALLTTITVTADGVSLVESHVVDGPAPRHVGAPPLMRYDLQQDDGTTVASYRGWYPRWTEAEDAPDATGGQGVTVQPSATAVLSFPFDPRVHVIDVADLVQDSDLGPVDVTAAVVEFCQDNPADDDCTTDLALSKVDTMDPATAGTVMGYTLEVRNLGSNPAQAVQVSDTLPDGLTLAGGDPRCSAAGQQVTCDLGTLYGGDTDTVSLIVAIAPDLVHLAGAPLQVSNSAVVDNIAGLDTDAGNDADSEDTLVVAVADLSTDAVEVHDPPVEIIIGEPVSVTVTTTIGNAGPSSPMDTHVASTASAPAGATASPATDEALEPAIAVSSPRTHDQAHTLACQTPGPKTFTFGTEVSPDRPDDTDPDASNNAASTSIVVDCLVPVALNIHPGSTENPINVSKDGVIPTAVLTTEAGEYDLPLAFDATSIAPLTVRFGPRSLIDGGGGASEAHQRSHLVDARERSDERTRDGDTDAVLHFPAPSSGLSAGDTEACARGEFRGSDGVTYRFIGCDVVRAF